MKKFEPLSERKPKPVISEFLPTKVKFLESFQIMTQIHMCHSTGVTLLEPLSQQRSSQFQFGFPNEHSQVPSFRNSKHRERDVFKLSPGMRSLASETCSTANDMSCQSNVISVAQVQLTRNIFPTFGTHASQTSKHLGHLMPCQKAHGLWRRRRCPFLHV